MIEWEPNKNDANLNMPVDGQVASICWNEQTKLLTMSLVYSAVYGMGERYNGLNQNDRIVKIEVEEKFCNQGDKSYCPSPFFFHGYRVLFLYIVWWHIDIRFHTEKRHNGSCARQL